MGKKPLSRKQVRSLRVNTQHHPLHSLLLNLSIDLMLRSSDLLSLKVKDVFSEQGEVRDTVVIPQKKTGKGTIPLPLSQNSRDAIFKHLSGREPEEHIFVGQMSHKTKKPITTQQYARIIKGWMRELEVEDVSRYSTHSMRKTKASVLFQEFKNVEAVRKLLGHRSVMATSSYLDVEDADATELARSIEI